MRSLFVLFTVVALAWGQHHHMKCNCGMFVTVDMAEYEVYRQPSIDLDSCEEEVACKEGCIREWEYVFNNGGLHFVGQNRSMSIGDSSCLELALDFDTEYFSAHEVFGYYKICDGPWFYDGERSLDHLCCHHGYYPGDCE